MKLKFLYYYLSILVILVESSAQPNVKLSAERSLDSVSIIFTFTQDNLASMEGCHYNLFAGDQKKDLNKLPGRGISIATFYKPLAEVKIIAKPLQQMSRLLGRKNPKFKRSSKVYFRTLLSCPEAIDGVGNFLTLRIPTYKHGKLRSVNLLIKDMKYHMQYYTPEI